MLSYSENDYILKGYEQSARKNSDILAMEKDYLGF